MWTHLRACAVVSVFGVLASAPDATAAEVVGVKPGAGELPAEKAAPAEPAEFTNDLVILKSDLAIEGKVVRTTTESIHILVEYGVLTIPRSKVKSVEYNLSARAKTLKDDDHVGRYRLAIAALEEGNLSQARDVLLGLVGKDGVPQEINKRLAQIYESQGELEKALEHWRTYALAKPNDETARARIAELEKRLGKAPAVAAAQPGAPGAAAGTAPAVAEGLEVGAKWEVLTWGNAATIGTQDIEGNQVLSVDIPGGDTKDKAAVGRATKLDFTAASKLAFRAFSAEKTRVEVAVALITAADYYESRPVVIRPDWNTGLEVGLQSSTWKSQKSNWRFEAKVEGLDEVRQVIFLIYCGKRNARLYFDNVVAE